MTPQHELYIKSLIRRILDDSAQPFILRSTLCPRGMPCDPDTLNLLQRWETQGYLRVLGNPNELADDAPIVEMLRYIDGKSPIPGFLNFD